MDRYDRNFPESFHVQRQNRIAQHKPFIINRLYNDIHRPPFLTRKQYKLFFLAQKEGNPLTFFIREETNPLGMKHGADAFNFTRRVRQSVA